MRPTLLFILLGPFSWGRRWLGGHWERWHMDGAAGLIWFAVPACYKDLRPVRLEPAMRGTPQCEDHGAPRVSLYPVRQGRR